MSQAYLGIPIAITVEGANALTRSLISFGQVRLLHVARRTARRELEGSEACFIRDERDFRGVWGRGLGCRALIGAVFTPRA